MRKSRSPNWLETHASSVFHQLGPEVFDLLRLREEAVSAYVEPVTVVLDGARDPAAVLRVFFDDADSCSALDELMCRSQAGRSRAEDHGRIVELPDRPGRRLVRTASRRDRKGQLTTLQPN